MVTALGDRVAKCDELDGLELFCYTDCDGETDARVQRVRGVVFEGDRVVFQACTWIPTRDAIDQETLDRADVHELHEGTTIRVFFHGGKWYVSTHRHLNAFESTWATATSFGELFKQGVEWLFCHDPVFSERIGADKVSDAFDAFLGSLNEELQYVYTVKPHDANAIEYTPPRDHPQVFHLYTVERGTTTRVDGCSGGVPTIHEASVPTVEDVRAYLESPDASSDGLFFEHPDGAFKMYKLDYANIKHLRGNQPDLLYRYLELRMNAGERMKFMYFFNDFAKRAEEIENVLYDVAVYLSYAYKNKYIEKQRVFVKPRAAFNVLRKVFDRHPPEKPLPVETFIDALNAQPPAVLATLLKYPPHARRIKGGD